jgi:hypothetical protein
MPIIAKIAGTHISGGKIGDSVILHNQFFSFVVSPLWTREMWEGILQGCTVNSEQLAVLWQTMSPEEKNSWIPLAIKNNSVAYGEFTAFNYKRIVAELDPVKTPT